MKTNKHSSYRPNQEKLDYFLEKKLIIMQNIWLLIVLSRFLTLLILILTYYHERF